MSGAPAEEPAGAAAEPTAPGASDPEPAARSADPAARDGQPATRRAEPAAGGAEPAARDTEPAHRRAQPGAPGAEATRPLRPPRRMPLIGGLGLSLATIGATVFVFPTLVALLHGGWHLALLGAGAIALCCAVGLVSWWPHRRRAALAIGAGALAVSLPIALPVPRGARDRAAPVRSFSVFGGEPGTPWFAGIPEAALIRPGERVGWQPRELRTVRARGWVWEQYAAFDDAGLFDRPESIVLDSWLFDRGHYWLRVPEGEAPAAGHPLIVFLHGSGGNFRAYPYWLSGRAAARGIATAYPTWGFGDWRQPGGAQRVLDVIADASERGPIDPARVVLVGLSNGGIGAVHVQGVHPDRFLAVATISGAPSRGADGSVAARVPWYIVHGMADTHVPVGWSRDLRDAIETAGGEVVFNEVPDEDHTLLMIRTADVLDPLLDWARERLDRR